MRESDKQMLAEHYLDLYQMAYNVLHNETDSEDAVQEALALTMSQMWLSNPYSYCTKVLYNYCYKLIRSQYVLVEKQMTLISHEDKLSEQQLTELWQLKEQLPQQLNEIFNLRYDQGLNVNQISQHTGFSLTKVKKLLRMGHQTLREQYNNIRKEKSDLII